MKRVEIGVKIMSDTKKKVIVIGGGVAGLSAGIYAQKCGFDITMFVSEVLCYDEQNR